MIDFDKSICPICGKKNNCAVLAGKDASSCWCQKEKVPQRLLAQIPTERLGACVCQNCIISSKTVRKSSDEI
ncbi:MAG: cysteine-rich CWC family protein [Desulfotalea sp.]